MKHSSHMCYPVLSLGLPLAAGKAAMPRAHRLSMAQCRGWADATAFLSPSEQPGRMSSSIRPCAACRASTPRSTGEPAPCGRTTTGRQSTSAPSKVSCAREWWRGSVLPTNRGYMENTLKILLLKAKHTQMQKALSLSMCHTSQLAKKASGFQRVPKVVSN